MARVKRAVNAHKKRRSTLEAASGYRGQRGEGGLVGDGKVGQDLSVNGDPGQAKALDEAVVGDVVGAGRGVDPYDPQPAEVALASFPIPVGVGG